MTAKAEHLKKQMEKLANIKAVNNDDTRNVGTPIFKKEQVLEYSNVLDLFLRYIFVKNNITIEHFYEKFRDYAIHKAKLYPRKVNSQRNNFLKAIKKGNISYYMWITILQHVLGYSIENIIIDIDNNGTPERYRLEDVFKFSNEMKKVLNTDEDNEI